MPVVYWSSWQWLAWVRVVLGTLPIKDRRCEERCKERYEDEGIFLTWVWQVTGGGTARRNRPLQAYPI